MLDCVRKLGEFGPVRIFLSIETERGTTVSMSEGSGNIYAQQGVVREWQLGQDRLAQMEVEDYYTVGAELDDDDDEDDSDGDQCPS